MQQLLDLFSTLDEQPSFEIDHASPDLESYQRICLATSGGKDSLACLLHLLELGVSRERIELHHHCVDGKGSAGLMDWPVTESYCKALAKALGLPIYFSWREGGFEREMLREGTPTAPVRFERPDGRIASAGGEGPAGTRRRFPQVSADLSVRWCSAYLKVDVCSRVFTNDERFDNSRTLLVTGERADESGARARYKSFERHRTDTRDGKKRRHVDHWRPVHAWSEQQVWDIIKRHRIHPHPAYLIGMSRTSCMACIFGSASQWATVRALDHARFQRIADYEREFGVTIQRKHSVEEAAARGTQYPYSAEAARLAMSREFNAPIMVDDWTLPPGAFGEASGPT